jgi:hypothetical protein
MRKAALYFPTIRNLWNVIREHLARHGHAAKKYSKDYSPQARLPQDTDRLKPWQ